MSALGKRVIYVGPADGSNHKPVNIEGLAVAATPPGTVMSESATGLTANADAATIVGKHAFMVADKDQQRSKSVDDNWTIAENMVAIAPRSGDLVNVLVITAQALVTGTPLARSGTAGALKIAVTPATVGVTSEEVVGYADETVTTTGTQLVRVRVA